jgi:hypothetical protein
MDDRSFAIYLRDHLAGAEAASQIVRRLRRHPDQASIGGSMERLGPQFEEERAVLRSVIRRISPDEQAGVTKQALGIAGGLLAWARQMALPGRTPSLVEDLEALAVGVWGKRLLWGALARAAARDERLIDIEVERLVKTAEAQEVELLRLRDEALSTFDEEARTDS